MIKIVMLLLSMSILTSCNAENTAKDELTKDELTKVQAMFITGENKKYVIASPMEGVLMQDGEPLANAKIIRQLRWNGNEDGLVEEYTTDEKGHFSLPLHEEELSLGMLSQFVGKSYVFVNTQDYDDLIWGGIKYTSDIYSEIGDGPLEELVCDISSPLIGVKAEIGSILTKCQWLNMPK